MSASSSTLGTILLPKERGSWSLVLEPIALGPRVLRADTAPLAALACLAMLAR